MEFELGRNLKKLVICLALAVSLPSGASGGTRMIPPPPPNHANDPAVGGVVPDSTWGVYPGAAEATRTRREAMRDDEGVEIDFNRETDFGDNIATYRRRNTNRAPAGLEMSRGNSAPASSASNAASKGWRSKPNDDVRKTANESSGEVGQRPVLKRISQSEEARQSAETEKFVTEVSDPVTRRKGVQEVSIIAGDLGFFPKTIFVSRDVPVRLYVTGTSKGSLCLMMDTFNIRKQVRMSKIEEITFVPTQPGTFRFYCPVNGSEGTMVVKELTSAAPEEMAGM
ncbi:MAG: cupredoxin domain-containing protein [Cryobacterium sp.]|nr:cupredoxin domain-containing protein [Oligoflexia bacterium]